MYNNQLKHEDLIKYEKYIYLTICESLFNSFKNGYFNTFPPFCRNLFHSLLDSKTKTISINDSITISDVIDKLKLIYFLNDETSIKYLRNFVGMDIDHIVQYYKILIIDNNFFINSVD